MKTLSAASVSLCCVVVAVSVISLLIPHKRTTKILSFAIGLFVIVSALNVLSGLSNVEIDEAVIYLNSEGGLYCSMQIMLDIINHSKIKITLIAVEHIMSCAFLLFYFAKCDKILMTNCYGCVHTISSSFELRDKKFEGDIV